MPEPRRSPYEVLGLAPDASEEEIRLAARRLRQRTHPDRCAAPDAAERFREVQEAYEALGTAEGRAQARRQAVERGPGPHDGAPPPGSRAQAAAAAAGVWRRYAAARAAESAQRRRHQQAAPDWSRAGWQRRRGR